LGTLGTFPEIRLWSLLLTKLGFINQNTKMMEKELLHQNRAHRQKRKRIRKINTTYLEGTSPEPKETQSMYNVNERDKNRVIWRFAKFPQHLLLCISVLGGVFGDSSNLYCWGEGFALKDLLRFIIRGKLRLHTMLGDHGFAYSLS
jgi:hypothetical protein